MKDHRFRDPLSLKNSYNILAYNELINMRTYVIVFNLRQLDYKLIHLKTQL